MHESVEAIVELTGVSSNDIYDIVQSVFTDTILEVNTYCETPDFMARYNGHNDIYTAVDMINEMAYVGASILEQKLQGTREFLEVFGKQAKMASGLLGVSFGFIVKKQQIEDLAIQYADDCWDQYLQIPMEDKELFVNAMAYDLSVLLDADDLKDEFVPYFKARFDDIGKAYVAQLQ